MPEETAGVLEKSVADDTVKTDIKQPATEKSEALKRKADEAIADEQVTAALQFLADNTGSIGTPVDEKKTPKIKNIEDLVPSK